jgi:hypothetical protein
MGAWFHVGRRLRLLSGNEGFLFFKACYGTPFSLGLRSVGSLPQGALALGVNRFLFRLENGINGCDFPFVSACTRSLVSGYRAEKSEKG